MAFARLRAVRARAQRGLETRWVEVAGTESHTTEMPIAGHPVRAQGSWET